MKLKYILDLVLIKHKRRCIVKDVRAYKIPECGMDHYMIKTKNMSHTKEK
jgi:hypothetical protein